MQDILKYLDDKTCNRPYQLLMTVACIGNLLLAAFGEFYDPVWLGYIFAVACGYSAWRTDMNIRKHKVK